MVQLSHPYRTTGKTIALTRWRFVGKVMSLLFNMLKTGCGKPQKPEGDRAEGGKETERRVRKGERRVTGSRTGIPNNVLTQP